MKKNQLLIASILLLAIFSGTSSIAQITVGVKGGISIPNLSGGSTSNPLNTGYSSRIGPDFALFADFHIAGIFSLQPQVEYSSQGGKKDGMQAFPNPMGSTPAYLYADYNSETKLNYLLIPVMARIDLKLSQKFKFYVMAGPEVGFLLSAKQVNSGNSPTYLDDKGTTPISPPQSFDTTVNVKSSINSTNFGIEGAIGFSYKIGNGNVFVEGGGNYGFINIQKNSADGQNNTGAASITVGYAYKFHCDKK